MLYSDVAISFPGLGIGPIDPPRTLPFTIFGKEIYFYGLIIAVGFLVAILYCRSRCKSFGFTFDNLLDAILITVPIAIVCARIYYVAFQWDYYKDNPISALYIWEGGLAIYGGVIGAVLGLALFSKVKKQPILPYLDITGLGLLIGQLIGRWGNFFNREAYGAEIFDRFFLRMGLTEPGGVPRYWHPTFLYESVWNLIGFVLIHFLSKKRKYDGQVFLMYLAWYGLGRVWIEGLRTDSLYLPGTELRVSQLLAGASFVTAAAIMLWIRFVKKPDGSRMLVNRAGAQTGTPSETDQAPAAVEKTEAAAQEKEAEAEAAEPAVELTAASEAREKADETGEKDAGADV